MSLFMNPQPERKLRWGWMFALGLTTLFLGIVALATSVLTTVISAGVLGLLLLLAGISMMLHAIEVRSWNGFWMNLALGVLYGFAGFYLFLNPLAGAMMLTLIIGIMFLAGGLVRCAFALIKRFEYWGLFLSGGLASVLLGALILAQWPVSGLYVIGLFVGIDLIITGTSLIGLSLQVRTSQGAV